jgi:hypothetical protein
MPIRHLRRRYPHPDATIGTTARWGRNHRLLALAVVATAALSGSVAGHDGHGDGPGAAGAGHGGPEPHAQARLGAPGEILTVTLVNSELVVGPNRFAVGLLGADGVHVQHARVHLHYYDLRDPGAPVLESEADAIALSTPDGFTTIFAHERAFPWPGAWGVEVQALLPDDRLATSRIAFQVAAEGRALATGERVPAMATPTVESVGGDLTRISSALEPKPELYLTSLAEAASNGRPTVLLFATPGYCRTRFCGPSYAVVSSLQERYAQEADFIHVEVFSGMPNPAANDWQLAPAVVAFGLRTEPWLYLIDPGGTVAHRVEGMFTEAEVERHLRTLLAR